MAVVAAIAVVGAAAYSADQARKASRGSIEQIKQEESNARREAAQTEADLFIQAEAAQAERNLVAGRIQLAYQAEAEARRQAQTKGVEYVFGQTAKELRDQRARRNDFYAPDTGGFSLQ